MQRIAVELEARSARRDPPQSRSGRRVSLSHRDRRAARFRRLSRERWRRRSPKAASPNCAQRQKQARARRPHLRHRLHRRGRAQRLQHGLHHHRADAGGARARPGRRTARRQPRRSRSIRSARCRVHVASVPQGQGHRTVLAQVVADAFGLEAVRHPRRHRDRHRKDAWSIASGNYASRFAPAVGGAAQLAAERIGDKLARSRRGAAQRARPDDVEFAGGTRARARQSRQRAAVRARRGGQPLGAGHAARRRSGDCARPCSGRRRNSPRRPRTTRSIPRSATASSSISAASRSTASTGAVRIDKYVTMHDCGRILHPGMVAGQVTGGFAQALGAALYEEYAYGDGRQLPRRHLRRLSDADDDGSAGRR